MEWCINKIYTYIVLEINLQMRWKMIEFLSNWAKDICLAVVVISILEMILPNNKSKKYVKMVMGVYLLFTMISPFVKNSKNLDLENMNIYEDIMTSSVQTENEIDQTSMDKRLNQIYKEELEKDIKEKIENKGYIINSCKVEVELKENQKNSGINKIVLKVKKKNVENQEENQNLESKMVEEIQKIKKVEIGEKEEEKEEGEQSITNTDKKEIRNFLIEEYGVSEECLEIS